MFYIQDFESFIGNLDLTEEEHNALKQFTDCIIGIQRIPEEECDKLTNLLNTICKIKAQGQLTNYLKFLLRHENPSMDNFSSQMDRKL